VLLHEICLNRNNSSIMHNRSNALFMVVTAVWRNKMLKIRLISLVLFNYFTNPKYM